MYYHIHLFNMFTHKENNAYFATTQVQERLSHKSQHSEEIFSKEFQI